MDDSTLLKTALEIHYSESLCWAAHCCLGTEVEAEAVLQDVYLKVLAGQARYDNKAAFKTWLFAVIRRTAADERRRLRLRRLLLERRPASITVEANFDEPIYRAELQQLVQEIMQQLPQRQREILQLIFYHEFSLTEAAQVLGISSGTAHKHYERAKRNARARLEERQIYAGSGRNHSQRTLTETEISATESGG